MMDEGYIKFDAIWQEAKPFSKNILVDLNACRDLMYQMKLIGAYDNGIGFGNISQRYQENQFFISGSATGNFAALNESHYTLVTNFNIQENWVKCKGPIVASSESMSHAVIYQECPEVNVVIHIHHLSWWKNLLYKIPTTADTAAYGSPEMANEIVRLFKKSEVAKTQVFAMAGHEEGLFGFGKNFKEASDFFVHLFQEDQKRDK